jgi:ribosomal protein S18 acetylase RimI-like enzyme
MSHHCNFLSEKYLPELYRTFRAAFSDYVLDMSHLTEEKFLNRVMKNGIDLGSSVGAFANDNMVGFTMVGLDSAGGVRCAFDIGTGIVKAYRGRGIAGEMFAHAAPGLIKKGVKRFTLEVIQTNERAVRAYEGVGFRIAREFDCFELQLENVQLPGNTRESVEIREIDRGELSLFQDFLDWEPSWENSFASIGRIRDGVTLLGAVHEGEFAGLLVYYPTLNWIMCLAVSRSFRRQGVATGLVRHLTSRLRNAVPTVRLLNVVHSDTAMLAFLDRIGFRLFTSQFEMSLNLT